MDAFAEQLHYLSTLTNRQWFITSGVVALVMFLLMFDYRK